MQNVCPRCNSHVILEGGMSTGAQHVGRGVFVPNGTSIVFHGPTLFAKQAWMACTGCGLIWNEVEAEKIRKSIEVCGTELARQYLSDLDNGPGHDLPAIPEAQEAARKVMEINGLVLKSGSEEFAVGVNPLATRRYRELIGCTWDQALTDLGKWHRLKRAEKLAKLGWNPPEKLVKAKAEFIDHPLRDRELDG